MPPTGDVPRGTDLPPLLRELAARIRSSPHNLVSRRAAEELERRHLPECVELARLLPAAGELVDIGSGGGLPGLVVAALRPDLRTTLVEATAKKARFLEATAADLAIAATVVHGRVEDHERLGLSARFDLATARAVAPLLRLVPWALPLLRPGGLLYAVKGERWEEELRAAEPLPGGARVIAVPPDPRACSAHVDPPLRVVIIARP